jgi:HSP20 family molecular chaperone IbpA
MTWQPPGSEVLWSAFPPPVSISNDEEGSTVMVDMPGLDPADVDLTFEAGTLAITGKRGARTYNYKVTLDSTIDPSTVEAKLDKGVLTVTAHKRPEARPRKILVNGAIQKSLDSGQK